MEHWYVPITLLPSIGFFIVAITSVSNALSAEIARLIELEKPADQQIIHQKIRQLRLTSMALVLLYAGAVFLSIAGLIAGLDTSLGLKVKMLVEIMVCLGIATTVGAMGIMMVYAVRAVRIKRQQFENM